MTRSKPIKIAIVGPESSGKSTLAADLAEHFEVPYVEEFAREYLENLDRPYTESDLIEIAKGQIELKAKLQAVGHSIIISDTSLLVIKIWSEVKYGRCDEWIISATSEEAFDLYFLCYPDIPWEYDPLRENPNDRLSLYQRYEKALQNNDAKYQIIRGLKSERMKIALDSIEKLR